MEMKKKIQFFHGGSSVANWEAFQQRELNNSYYLENLKGWDESTNIEMKTSQKLIGSGSYVLGFNTRERELEITINFKRNEVDFVNFRNMIRNQILNNTIIKMVRTFESGSTVRKETLEGYITSLSEWNQIGEEVSFTFFVKCVDPDIVIS